MIKERKGDLLRSDAAIIAHQVNCQGVMGVVLCQEKVQIKYALLMLSYPAKASALSSNAA